MIRLPNQPDAGNPELSTANNASGLPGWVTISWFIVFPPAFFLTARLVYEQTFLTWARGLQMVGFTLAHQGIGLLILGTLALGLSHVWLLAVMVLVTISKRYRILTLSQAVISAATVLILLLNYVPYVWWQRLVVLIPGSTINERDIFLEAVGEGRLGTVKSLLPPKTDVKTINKALFGACVEGQIDVLNFLLKKGADVNCIGDDLGETPLMAATQMGHAEAARILLAHGADPNAKTTEGKTALSLALEYKHPETAAVLQRASASRR